MVLIVNKFFSTMRCSTYGMPNSVVVTLAHRAHKPVAVVESLWRRAKRFAAREGQKGNFLFVAEAVKRMLGLTESMKTFTIGQRVTWKDIDGDSMTGIVHGTLPDCCMIKVEPGSDSALEAILRARNGFIVVPLLEVEPA